MLDMSTFMFNLPQNTAAVDSVMATGVDNNQSIIKSIDDSSDNVASATVVVSTTDFSGGSNDNNNDIDIDIDNDNDNDGGGGGGGNETGPLSSMPSLPIAAPSTTTVSENNNNNSINVTSTNETSNLSDISTSETNQMITSNNEPENNNQSSEAQGPLSDISDSGGTDSMKTEV